MTEPRFERDLTLLLAELGDRPTPAYRDAIVERTLTMRQRPAWTFGSRLLPFDLAPIRATSRLSRPVAALLLVALLVAALIVAGVGREPTRLPPPFGLAANGQLVYARGGDVLVRDSPDAPARVLVAGPEPDTFAWLSRQGDRFVFFRSTDSVSFDVWIADLDGSGARRLAGPFHDFAWWDWSEDGSLFAIETQVSSVATVTLIRTDGTGTIRVDTPAQSPIFRPGHPDQILVRAFVERAWRFALIDPSGTITHVLDVAPSGAEGDLVHPAWSPLGDRFAFDSTTTGMPAWRVHVAEVDDAGVVTARIPLEFESGAESEAYPVWMPTGEEILYSAVHGGVKSLLIARPEPGAVARRIGPTETGEALLFEPSPDGRTVSVVDYTNDRSWIVDVASGASTEVELGTELPASWERDPS